MTHSDFAAAVMVAAMDSWYSHTDSASVEEPQVVHVPPVPLREGHGSAAEHPCDGGNGEARDPVLGGVDEEAHGGCTHRAATDKHRASREQDPWAWDAPWGAVAAGKCCNPGGRLRPLDGLQGEASATFGKRCGKILRNAFKCTNSPSVQI